MRILVATGGLALLLFLAPAGVIDGVAGPSPPGMIPAPTRPFSPDISTRGRGTSTTLSGRTGRR